MKSIFCRVMTLVLMILSVLSPSMAKEQGAINSRYEITLVVSGGIWKGSRITVGLNGKSLYVDKFGGIRTGEITSLVVIRTSVNKYLRKGKNKLMLSVWHPKPGRKKYTGMSGVILAQIHKVTKCNTKRICNAKSGKLSEVTDAVLTYSHKAHMQKPASKNKPFKVIMVNDFSVR